MKLFIALSILLLSLSIIPSNGDLVCDDNDLPVLREKPASVGKLMATEESNEKFADLLNKWGCAVKRQTKILSEQFKENAEKLNKNVKEGAQKLTVKAKEVGTDLKTKFHDLRDRLHKDSDEVVVGDKKLFMENVELINPDLLKADQECGHGHILDSLGNCKKLRK